MSHSCHTLLSHSCHTLLSHSCHTLLCHTHVTLYCHTHVTLYYVTLMSHSTMSHSCHPLLNNVSLSTPTIDSRQAKYVMSHSMSHSCHPLLNNVSHSDESCHRSSNMRQQCRTRTRPLQYSCVFYRAVGLKNKKKVSLAISCTHHSFFNAHAPFFLCAPTLSLSLFFVF